MSTVVLIGLGGCLGALLRWAASTFDRDVPWGIAAANVIASGLAAWLAGLDGAWDWLISVGTLGALSTWSTLAVASVRLARAERFGVAAMVLIGSTLASIIAAWAFLQM